MTWTQITQDHGGVRKEVNKGQRLLPHRNFKMQNTTEVEGRLNTENLKHLLEK